MHANAGCDLVALCHQTEEHFFAAICQAHRRYGACLNAYFTDEHFDPFSLLFIRVGSTSSDELPTALLDLIRRTVQEIRIVIHGEKVKGLSAVLTALGFQPAEKSTAMAFELSNLAPWVNDSDVKINLTRTMNDWTESFASAFLKPAEIVAGYQARHQRALEAGQGLYHFTLADEGQVRCSLTLSLCDGEARLNDVGTLMGFRGRGYATRLIHAALLFASSLGAKRCFLEASVEGFSVYQKLGFECLFDYQSFTRGLLAVA
ncbi:GNAT family N-acetyltransferase [Pseudomonas sp. IB20]|uniref:GNAT family N-acetyltransferase n=1 Tax=Pseudomonas sp. IB20 TaxID=1702250 RepID=UPI000BA11426|nr:GNAT family N-acetyltransferase [Pseudomonas sp. IB20]OZO03952.1 GNAT family N-acetyltransferase [Pseudomonas sp. IB20]